VARPELISIDMATKTYKLKVTFSKYLDNYFNQVMVVDSSLPLREADEVVVRNSFNLWIRLLTDLLLNNGNTFTEVNHCIRSTLGRCSALHYREVLKTLEELDQCLLNGCKLTAVRIPDTIIWLAGVVHRNIFYQMPLGDQHQWFTYMKRITLFDREDLLADTEVKYFGNLSRLSELPDVEASESDLEAEAIAWVLEDYQTPTLEDCSYSAGDTADQGVKTVRAFKYFSSRVDERAAYFCKKNELYQGRIEPDIEAVDFEELIIVPKSWKAYRVVKPEYEFRNFYQNGVAKQIIRCIREKIPDSIDFENQDRSRMVALEGSRHGLYATIDLSSASDSVRRKLVKKFFRKKWKVLRDMLCLSSNKFTYKGEVWDNPSMFSMGAPLCFPVQSLVYWAIAFCAIVRIAGFKAAIRARIVVYGDDIIVNGIYAEAVISALEHYGFVVNHDKTFCDPRQGFRESCGMEAYLGQDITPVRIGRKFQGFVKWYKNTKRDSQGPIISMANAHYGHGHTGCAKYLRDKVYRPLYSDDIVVLKDCSSSRIYDPNAAELNRKVAKKVRGYFRYYPGKQPVFVKDPQGEDWYKLPILKQTLQKCVYPYPPFNGMEDAVRFAFVVQRGHLMYRLHKPHEAIDYSDMSDVKRLRSASEYSGPTALRVKRDSLYVQQLSVP